MRTCSFGWVSPVSCLLHLGKSNVIKATFNRKAFIYKREVNGIHWLGSYVALS